MPRRPRTGSLRKAGHFRVVFVTASSTQEAGRLARAVVRRKLAACVNVLSGVQSWYWWEGKVTSGREALLVIKTLRSRLPRLYQTLKAQHSYQVPEFLALPTSDGSRPYLGWLRESLR